MSTQLRRWAFTLNGNDVASRIEEIKENLERECKRWVFQLEQGKEEGKLHLQGRLSCQNGKRLNELQQIIKGAHFSIESKEEDSGFYCTKEETRVKGPWSDKDKKHPLPWDLEKIKEWRPWQLSVFESLNTLDDRTINVLIDKDGGIGKTKVFKFACWKKWAGLVPVIGDAKDIIQAVCSMGAKKAYILDLPRSGENDQHMKSIWKAVEQIKNGVVIDLRYKYTEIIMGSPVVWVFTNHEPKRYMLSKDRWRLWKVVNSELVPF